MKLLFLILTLLIPLSIAFSQADGIETRKTELLELLSDLPVDESNTSWRRLNFKHTSSLLLDRNVNEALAWFNNESNYSTEEWDALLLIRSYYALKDSRHFTVSGAGQKIKAFLLNELLPEVRANTLSWTGYTRPDREGTWAMSENHTIVGFSIRLLLEEMAGNNKDQALWDHASSHIRMWCFEKASRGFIEYFSPHYSERSVIALLNIMDFSKDPVTRTSASMIVDLFVAEYTQVQINGFRGGAARRINQSVGRRTYAPEMSDSRYDCFFTFGKFLFGEMVTSEPFNYPPGDQTIGHIFYATTSYRPSQVLVNMADIVNRGELVLKSARRYSHGGTGGPHPDAYIYAYATPHYVLSSIRIPDNAQWGTHTTTSGLAYRLSFHKPRAMLGTARDTSSYLHYMGDPNSARAIFQHKNLLVYHGRMDTYEEIVPVIAPEDRIAYQEIKGNYRFFREPGLGKTEVYVGVFEKNGIGILEAGLSDEHKSWKSFKKTFKKNMAVLHSMTEWRYRSSDGTLIEQEGNTIEVNGEEYATTDWPLFDSEYMKASFLNQDDKVGLIQIGNDRTGQIILDFRDIDNPVRNEVLLEGSVSRFNSRKVGLVGYYPFEEGVGYSVYDHSGMDNHGMVIGNPAWKEGKYGKGFWFDGYSKINLGDRADLHFEEPEFTFMAWVKPEVGKLDTSYSRFGEYDFHWTIFSDRNSWAGSGYNLAFFSSRTSSLYEHPDHYYTIECVFNRTKPGGDNRIETWHDPDKNIPSTNSIEIVDGKWHHIAIRISRDRTLRAILVDGERREFQNNINMVDDFYIPGNGDVIIGGFQGKAPGFWEFRGMMDEVKFFNRLLSDEEVREEMGNKQILTKQ
jgi:hypothetical protein